MQYNKNLFLVCRSLVEDKVGWGDSKEWTNSDFTLLSEKILSETGVNLSTSTLKRLWGKVKYEGMPQLATLNALARFVGYASFRDLEAAHLERADKELGHLTKENLSNTQPETDLVPVSLPSELPKETPARKRRISMSGIWAVGLFMGISLSLLIAFSVSIKQKKDSSRIPAHFSFSSRPVAEGIPNSVVFTFDASQAKTDCVFIQQSWDPGKRFKVSKNQKQATSIYYLPGFFTAKLVVDNKVVQEHSLHIKTKGWLPIVEQEPVPVYFTPEESIQGGMLSLSEEKLQSSNIALQPVAPWVCYYYVQDVGAISSDNFTLETALKNTFARGSSACQLSQVIVLLEQSVMGVSLSIPGCTSSIDAFFAGTLLKGNQTDLSALGVDFKSPVKLRIDVKNKAVQVYINEKAALQTSFSMNAGKIIGLAYRFQGTGAVDYVRLVDPQGNVLLKEDF